MRLKILLVIIFTLFIGYLLGYSTDHSLVSNNQEEKEQEAVLSETTESSLSPSSTISPSPTLVSTPIPTSGPAKIKIIPSPKPTDKPTNLGCAEKLVNEGYVGYKGWDDEAACNDFQKTKGEGKGKSKTPSYSFPYFSPSYSSRYYSPYSLPPIYFSPYSSPYYTPYYSPSIYCSSYSIGDQVYTHCY